MMVETHNLSIELGKFRLHRVSLQIERGEYFAIVGPTGAGKTIFLECIAGLLTPAAGSVRIDGHDVTDWAPEHRRIGYLPQDYALFPHLSVRRNLLFGLTVRKRRNEGTAAVERLSAMLGIGALLERFPGTLSGGEKQRVALGRALATQPVLMLLDEPLSALDGPSREHIGAQLREVHDQTGVTSIHVTHDLHEAMRLADRMALVRDGRVIQVGTPEELVRQPQSLFAARFVRGENLFVGQAEGEAHNGWVRVGDARLRCHTALRGPLHVMIRPDEARLLEQHETVDGMNVIHGRISRVEDRGVALVVRVVGELELNVLVPRAAARGHVLDIGGQVRVGIAAEGIHTFPREQRQDTPEQPAQSKGVKV